MKISIIGGGSTYTPELIKGIMEIREAATVDEICFYDINQERLDTLYEFSRRLVKGALKISKRERFEECVKDSDFVVFQFRPGGLEGRLKDETIPLKYGLVGQETTGVGGFAAALRAFPVIEDYINRIERTNPRAFVVNFTNPSGHITEFVLNHLKFERFVGLCNIPINLIKAIASLFGTSLEEVDLKYYGLNHLSFLERVFVKGEDVTHKVFEQIRVNPANMPIGDFPSWLIETLELLPNPYLRYYLMTGSVLEHLKEEEPRAKRVMEIERELLEKYKTSSEIPEELSLRGGSMYSTAAAYLIRDLVLGEGKMHVVNTRNEGSVKNLPDDYVLEIPAYVFRLRVQPRRQGSADPFALSFIHSIKTFERLTIEAYEKSSKKLALKALLSHPLGPKAENARDLLDELIAANGFALE